MALLRFQFWGVSVTTFFLAPVRVDGQGQWSRVDDAVFGDVALTIDHVDTAQILAFSLVMLNTDAHNDAIRKDRKMTQACRPSNRPTQPKK